VEERRFSAAQDGFYGALVPVEVAVLAVARHAKDDHQG
jgi:hypothetical protein